MARANTKAANETKETKETNYIEFDFTGKNKNDFKGRVYTDGKSYDTGIAYGISITINGVTIKGGKLWVPDNKEKDASFMWPSYKGKDGKYYDYIAFFEAPDKADVTEAANTIANMIV